MDLHLLLWLPFLVRIPDPAQVRGNQVGRRGDAARSSGLERQAEKLVGPGKNPKVSIELGSQLPGKFRIAGRVLQANEAFRVGVFQARDQVEREGNSRNPRDVVTEQISTFWDRLAQNFTEPGEQTRLAGFAEIVRRQD